MAVIETSGGNGAPRAPLDTQLRRYVRSYRRRLRKLAKSHSHLGDLIYTYPAAAFVIAAHQGNPLVRGEATKLVKEGAGLRKVGKCLGLPNWSRRLPPEAFRDGVGKLPNSDNFNRKITNLIPHETEKVGPWLHWVTKANALCHEDFALWIARQKIWYDGLPSAETIVPLAAFVWFSDAEGTKARGFVDKPWSNDIGIEKAVDGARAWFLRLLMEDCRNSTGSFGRWFVAQRVSGYRIVPLRTKVDLVDEGQRMINCVADYAGSVASGECLIYSVRRGNHHVATLEVQPAHAMDGTADVVQLLGPCNGDVDEGISRAVQTWLGRQGSYPYSGSHKFVLAGFDNRRWDELWHPFWEAHGQSGAPGGRRGSWLPFQVNRALEQLSCSV